MQIDILHFLEFLALTVCMYAIHFAGLILENNCSCIPFIDVPPVDEANILIINTQFSLDMICLLFLYPSKHNNTVDTTHFENLLNQSTTVKLCL